MLARPSTALHMNMSSDGPTSRSNPYMTIGKDIMRPIRKDMYGYYSRKFSKAYQPNKPITQDRKSERMKLAERPEGATRVSGYD